MTGLAAPIYDHAHPKVFDQPFTHMNLYQHAKNQAISLICSEGKNKKFWNLIG